jgi:Fe-S cluster biogenesis protein NfuA
LYRRRAVLRNLLPTFTANAGTSPPLKLAVFNFELEDFSAGASLPAGNSNDAEQLKRVTDEARQLLAQSGRYTLVDISSADEEAVKQHLLRNCDGCDAGIALKLGAEAILYRNRDENQQDGIHGAVSDPRRPDRRAHFQQADGPSHGGGLL